MNFPKWQFGLLVVSIIGLIILIFCEWKFYSYMSQNALSYSILSGLLSGIITAIGITALIEWYRYDALKRFYSNIAGKYVRTAIGQDGEQSDGGIQAQNKEEEINIKHIAGTNSIYIIANYWETSKASVIAKVDFQEPNRQIGHGVYVYNKGEQFVKEGHTGTYTIYNTHDEQLLVLYQHVYPRRLLDNPDKNKGWEVWTKQQ